MDAHREGGVLKRILDWLKGVAGGGRQGGSRKDKLEEVEREKRVERDLDRTYAPGGETVRDRTAFRQ